MTTRLISIELSNFRGFANTQQVDLDADIILVRGDNGTGKTSLTDGLLWLFTGRLPHLTDRVKGLRQTHDPIANRYGKGSSRVSLTVHNARGVWQLEREGNAQQSTVRALVNGEPLPGDKYLAQAFDIHGADELAAAVSTWGVLRQDAIRSVLDTGAAALHQRMSAVIGLSEVTRFRESCRTAAKASAQKRRAAAEELERTESLSAVAVRNLEASRRLARDNLKASITERLAAALSGVSEGLLIDLTPIEEVQGVVELGREVGALIEPASAAADSFDAYIDASAAVKEGSVELESDLSAAQAQAAELRDLTSSTQQLAEAALRLLTERCPVCAQSIDAQSVRQKLERDLAANTSRMVASNEARNMVSMLEQRLAATRAAETRRAHAETQLVTHAERLERTLSAARYVRIDPSLRGREQLRTLARRLDSTRSTLRVLHAEVQAEAEADELRLAAALDAARTQAAKARQNAEAAASSDKQAKQLDKAAQVAADTIVTRMLQQLEPSFAEVFDRLAPHPTFSELRARADVYYNKNQIVPEVVDPIRGVTANPLLVYSEGQLNTVALSYFLGLALNASSSSLGFMVLDDPLQAMDVLGVLGFADLCRRLRHERQLLITTHDRRYADLLARKLAPREAAHSTVVHEFESWSVEGPSIRSTRHDFAPRAPVLQRWTS